MSDQLRALLSDLKPASASAYISTANSTHALLYPDAQCMTDLDWLQTDYYKVPSALVDALAESSPVTLFARLGHLSSICTKLGYTEAHKFLHEFRAEHVDPLRCRPAGQLAPRTEANWVPYAQLHERAEGYMQAFDQLTCDLVLTEDDFKVHQAAMLSLMNVITPSTRSALACANIVADQSQVECNCVYIPAKGPCWLHISLDKVAGTAEPLATELPEYVSNALRRSYQMYPRRYLFPRSVHDDGAMSQHEYASRIKNLFVFGDRKAGIEVIRHSQVTEFYDRFNHAPTKAERDSLAIQMRHTSSIAELWYRRHDTVEVPPAALSSLV